MLASEILDRIPTDPGVYLFKDKAAKVVYVGKAKNLRTRVRQYFRPGGDERYFVAAGFLGRAVVDIETIVVTAEKEALLLENHLIKQHQPKFNVKLRDDKQYLVLRLEKPRRSATNKTMQYPRVQVVRNIRDDDAQYFGPYHSATSARQTLRILNRHFQLRTCTDHVLESRGKVCLQYQIKRCVGPCALPVDPQAYADQVDDVAMFLSGKDKELTDRLRARMLARADAEDFEAAAALRDSIGAVERTLARQDMVQDDFIDQDVWGLYRQADAVEVAVLFVRSGKLVGRRTFMQRDQELPDTDVIAEHVQQYYATQTFVPDEVVVGVVLDASAALAEWLSSMRGRKVRVIEPQRGQRARLVELADKNAAASAVSRRGRDDDAQAILQKLQERLGLARLPRRIECFDIAHIQGRETVASMVTFVDGVPAKNLYRKFKVKSVGNDDFASMYEVLSRRFRRAAEVQRLGGVDAGAVLAKDDELDASATDATDANEPDTDEATRDLPKTAKDNELDDASDISTTELDADTALADKISPWMAPDLLVVDGGKGQLGMAIAALTDQGFEFGERGLDVISLAKERDLQSGEAPDRVYLRNVKDPIALRQNSPELYVLARLRDEAHRFANTFHRARRSKAALRSELDDIPGIGPTRRKKLLAHFGSVRGVRAATEEQLRRVPGMTAAAAAAIKAAFGGEAETGMGMGMGTDTDTGTGTGTD
ncbi:MAG TPA: excinuclease ABC subunit UvrC [Kofleriaceae bacterium]|nr:excinuclease ABC subunit UvrC [Kofleriaceae bacterium]